jgi:hypothetical protein
MLEHRRSQRHKADRLIFVRCQNQRARALCTDYNDDGFGAVVENDLPIGEIVSIEFARAGRHRAPLQARTIYRNASRYGFEFVAPNGDLRRTIAEFFKESLEGDYGFEESPKQAPRQP